MFRYPKALVTDGHGQYMCILGCESPSRWMWKSKALRHEGSHRHIELVRGLSVQGQSAPSEQDEDDLMPGIDSDDLDADIEVEDANASMSFHSPVIGISGPALFDDPPDAIYDDWQSPLADHNMDDPAETHWLDDANPFPSTLFAGENDDQRVNSMTVDATDSDSDHGSIPSTGGDDQPLSLFEDDTEGEAAVTEPLHNGAYWPWKNAKEAYFDCMGAFPRAVFSEPELNITRWFAEKCGVDDIPTVRQIKTRRKDILKLAGGNPAEMDGKLGNIYTLLDLKEILAHEWANPLVRPHVTVYPEDAGEFLAEPSQAEKWRSEVSGALASPMVRYNGKDYFVMEPTLAVFGPNGEYGPVLPSRFFIRDDEFWARVQMLRTHPAEAVLVIDSRDEACIELPVSTFLLPYDELQLSYHHHGLPDPSKITHVARKGSNWTTVDLQLDDLDVPVVAPNPLRAIAAGRQVFSVPLWLYCDDTSGNVSKKWNKHNSLLITLAGLAPKYVHLIYNIHFLATSNIAPPLEMVEGFIEMLKDIQGKGGVEAYDCLYGELVLLLPWILGINGDNPMQSEFASHIGMTGRCFCRVCTASKGAAKETDRLREFMSVGDTRTTESTIAGIEAQLAEILRGAPSNASTFATASGVKDKYFQHFADILSEACAEIKEKRAQNPAMQGDAYLKETLKKLRDSFPADMFNPLLYVHDLNVNSDSPVEILHVILLGFVKYFWRDAVSRQTNETKRILKARINAFNVDGLGITKPRGHTLVHILQGLVPEPAYEAWLALSRLGPLAFQPIITDKTKYLTRLEDAIFDFLACTALWNTQWFNKPKFHVLLHLPRHVQRFGPGILFATESFESYNAVIRGRSVHSNHLAPSADIGISFSFMHAVRHLISGGYLRDPESGELRRAGQAILDLGTDKVFVQLMGMQKLLHVSDAGEFRHEPKSKPVQWSTTRAARVFPEQHASVPTMVQACSRAVLANEDTAVSGGYVAYLHRNAENSKEEVHIGRVVEIWSEVRRHDPECLLGFLIKPCSLDIEDTAPPYRMPRLDTRGDSEVWCNWKDCMAAISTFHNCAAHNCSVTQTKPVIQERRRRTRLDWEITHTPETEHDRVLNLAQLTNTVVLDTFRGSRRYPGLPLETHLNQLQLDADKAEEEDVDVAVSNHNLKEHQKLLADLRKDAGEVKVHHHVHVLVAGSLEGEGADVGLKLCVGHH
ncbi:hypothetical protein BDZ89DRAFT_1121660 [Hymenopellis radicata]|nr:hypothetical protein BDZ89DRAFT_1121660 [Hymenopellis radicata]